MNVYVGSVVLGFVLVIGKFMYELDQESLKIKKSLCDVREDLSLNDIEDKIGSSTSFWVLVLLDDDYNVLSTRQRACELSIRLKSLGVSVATTAKYHVQGGQRSLKWAPYHGVDVDKASIHLFTSKPQIDSYSSKTRRWRRSKAYPKKGTNFPVDTIAQWIKKEIRILQRRFVTIDSDNAHRSSDGNIVKLHSRHEKPAPLFISLAAHFDSHVHLRFRYKHTHQQQATISAQVKGSSHVQWFDTSKYNTTFDELISFVEDVYNISEQSSTLVGVVTTFFRYTLYGTFFAIPVLFDALNVLGPNAGTLVPYLVASIIVIAIPIVHIRNAWQREKDEERRRSAQAVLEMRRQAVSNAHERDGDPMFLVNEYDSPSLVPDHLSQDELDFLENRLATGEEGLCSICQFDIEGGDNIIALHCNHVFHHRCVYTYLSECSTKCPNCRGRAVPERKWDRLVLRVKRSSHNFTFWQSHHHQQQVNYW